MVKYYGRARQRIGSVNTNQLGLKMSGCPSRVGRNPVNARYIKQRVNCMQGTCGPIQIHGVNVPSNKFRNNPPYCKKRSTTCLAAAGGIGNINTPYYRTPAPGEKGCGCKFGPCGGGGEGFSLKAGSGVDEGVGVVGFLNQQNPTGGPGFGILNLEDSSPINKNDILAFIQRGNCSLLPSTGDLPPCAIITIIQLTPAILSWLQEKIAADEVEDPNDDGIPSFILNINGKQYKNIALEDEDDEPFFVAVFAPITELDTIEMKDGEFYNFSFK